MKLYRIEWHGRNEPNGEWAVKWFGRKGDAQTTFKNWIDQTPNQHRAAFLDLVEINNTAQGVADALNAAGGLRTVTPHFPLVSDIPGQR